MTDEQRLEAIARDPRYQSLVQRRGRYAALLSAVMLATYFGFVLMIAFDKPLLAKPVYGAISLGIPVGFGLILLAILLTGLYVRRANRDWDPAMAVLLAEHAA